eukprot:6174239-Pleurochrysis_carterae.AAC.1
MQHMLHFPGPPEIKKRYKNLMRSAAREKGRGLGSERMSKASSDNLVAGLLALQRVYHGKRVATAGAEEPQALQTHCVNHVTSPLVPQCASSSAPLAKTCASVCDAQADQCGCPHCCRPSSQQREGASSQSFCQTFELRTPDSIAHVEVTILKNLPRDNPHQVVYVPRLVAVVRHLVQRDQKLDLMRTIKSARVSKHNEGKAV